MIEFRFEFTEICSKESNCQEDSIGSGNGLVPKRHQFWPSSLTDLCGTRGRWVNFGPGNGLSPVRHYFNQYILILNWTLMVGIAKKSQMNAISSSLYIHTLTQMIWVKLRSAMPKQNKTMDNRKSLQWHHNERDGVSNHEGLDCLLNRLFRRRSEKTPKLRVTGLCEGNPPVSKRAKDQ